MSNKDDSKEREDYFEELRQLDRPQSEIEWFETKTLELEQRLKYYEEGFKGACPTCENIGETNLKLQERISIAIDALEFVAGIYTLEWWNQKLWDYSKEDLIECMLEDISKCQKALEKINGGENGHE